MENVKYTVKDFGDEGFFPVSVKTNRIAYNIAVDKWVRRGGKSYSKEEAQAIADRLNT